MVCTVSVHAKMESHIFDQMQRRATPSQANVDSIYIVRLRARALKINHLKMFKNTLKNAQPLKIKCFVLVLCIIKWTVTFLIKCTTARHRGKQMWIAYTLKMCARALFLMLIIKIKKEIDR